MTGKPKKEVKKKKKVAKPAFSFWKKIDEQHRKVILKVLGLIVGIFALFTLYSIIAYFFTWKADQSLFTDENMFDKDVEVANWGGKLGLIWSHFLVTGCFGLGSLAIVVLLGILAVKLFMVRGGYKVLWSIVLAFAGGFLFSLPLAYFSEIFGWGNIFGSGLGGDCGGLLVSGMVNLFGQVITFFVILLLLVVWLLLVSGRFSAWLSKLGEKKPGAEEKDDELELTSGSDAVNDEDESEEESADDYDAVQDGDDSGVADEEAGIPVRETVPPQRPAMAPATSIPLRTASDTAVIQEEADEGLEVVTDDSLTAEVQKDLPRIDNRDELSDYQFPPLDLLDDYASKRHEVASEELERNNNKIRATLLSYKIKVEKVTACVGPTVTLYKVVPAPGVKISSIQNLDKDIAMALKSERIRVVPLADSVGIEVPNDVPSIVPLKSMLNDDAFRNSKAELPVAIGYTITQRVKVFDLADTPHLLVAGATKQGKSVGLNVIITSLLYAKHPSELKFVFIDPKMVEFSAYGKLLKHYLAVMPDAANEAEEKENAIVKQPKPAEEILRALCVEMDERYQLLSKAGVNNLKTYNDKYRDRKLLPTEGHKYLPYIVVVVDEYADLIMSGQLGGDSKAMARSITTSIIRLAQKGRAAGIHVIIATQRPSVDVITGLIKTNFPTRIAFRVSSRVDSSTIIDSPGADRLIGRGDMLYYAGIDTERVQCAYIDMDEISKVTNFIGSEVGYKKSYSTPYYLPSVKDSDDANGGGMVDMQNIDEMFEEAAKLVVTTQQGSTSALQRRLGFGYARAGKVMDQLEAAGIVGPQEGSKPRQVLVQDLAALEPILKSFLG